MGTQKVENSPPKMTKGSSSAFAIGVAAVAYASLLKAAFAQGQGNICAAIQPILPSECTPSADCFQVNCNIGIGDIVKFTAGYTLDMCASPPTVSLDIGAWATIRHERCTVLF